MIMEVWWEHYATFPQLAICYFAIVRCVKNRRWCYCGMNVQIKQNFLLNVLSFCKVVFVAAYTEERKARNLDSLVDACQVLTTKSVLASVVFPF